MQINHCLILAAGFGTRMGVIGQKLPKVQWPVFEKSLLELQVAYARSLGAEKIYINLHYMGKEIESFCRSKDVFKDVEFLWEKPEILDIGGAVHNLASQPEVNYQGTLLVLNADQFFYIKEEQFAKLLQPHTKDVCVLLTYWVNSSQGYNALDIDEHRLVKRIIQNKDLPPGSKIETYTGISVINLSMLDKISGPSNFYKSVCRFETGPIPAVRLEQVDYWDFGTLKRYWDTMFLILTTYRTNSNHPFLRFLVNEKALKTWKIDMKKSSYFAKSARVLNLSQNEEIQSFGPSIIMADTFPERKEYPAVYWRTISEEVK
ncbi:MAG TPA: sugar phosphate nucleotidyltransferase [Bacteriovoracaceae bacterium]|nr:sugar phosphate nucleotidyltransferase [Bacteriovoracaceae bacterium]